MDFKIIDGGVCAAKGFKASGVYCAIKENPTKKNDIALIVSDVMCNAAGVYTSNKVKGAPVVVTKKNLEKSGGKAKAVIVNSKNANTCNADGEEKAEKMCSLAADALGIKGVFAATSLISVRCCPLSLSLRQFPDWWRSFPTQAMLKRLPL